MVCSRQLGPYLTNRNYQHLQHLQDQDLPPQQHSLIKLEQAIEGKEDTEGAENVEVNEVRAEKQAQEDAEVDTDEEY